MRRPGPKAAIELRYVWVAFQGSIGGPWLPRCAAPWFACGAHPGWVGWRFTCLAFPEVCIWPAWTVGVAHLISFFLLSGWWSMLFSFLSTARRVGRCSKFTRVCRHSVLCVFVCSFPAIAAHWPARWAACSHNALLVALFIKRSKHDQLVGGWHCQSGRHGLWCAPSLQCSAM